MKFLSNVLVLSLFLFACELQPLPVIEPGGKSGPDISLNNIPTDVSNLPVNVSGTVYDTDGIGSVTINGVRLTSGTELVNTSNPSSKYFTKSLSNLNPGRNTILIVATDSQGNQSTASIVINYNNTGTTSPPLVQIDSPSASDITVNSFAITITGVVKDPTGIKSIKIPTGTNIAPYWFQYDDPGSSGGMLTQKSFSADLWLAKGVNTISIIATNAKGQTTTVTRKITYNEAPVADSTPPTVTIIAPGTSETVTSSSYNVRVTANDSSGISSVTVNGSAASLVGSEYQKAITLNQGSNAITIVATDNSSAKNKTTVTRTITYNPPQTGSGTQYYVTPSPTGSCDSSEGNGSISQPFKSLYWVMTQSNLKCGDTLFLRGGTYRITRTNPFFNFEDRLANCSNKETSWSYGDGETTILPIFGSRYNCPATNPLTITNYPGEEVVLDGTDLRMDSGDNWQQCTSWGCCGAPVSGVSNLTSYYCSKNFNVSNSDTPQIWVSNSDSTTGDRLQWWANSYAVQGSDELKDHFTGMGPGKFFSVCGGTGSCMLPPDYKVEGPGMIVLRLKDDSNPNTKKIKLTCEGGSCSYNLITVTGKASNVIIKKSTTSSGAGNFRLKYSYFPIRTIGNSLGAPTNITFDGLQISAAGGRDYGQCIRVFDGNNITVKNVACVDSMAEGIGFYGGGPGDGYNPDGHNLTGNVVSTSYIYNTGLAYLDGGGKGMSSLGMGIILKNCSSCTAENNVIQKTLRGGIQINTSDNCINNTACYSNNVTIRGNTVSDNCRIVEEAGLPYPGDSNRGSNYCGAVNAFLANGETKHQIRNLSVSGNMLWKNYTWLNNNGANPGGVTIDGPVQGSVFNNTFNNGLQLINRGGNINAYGNILKP